MTYHNVVFKFNMGLGVMFIKAIASLKRIEQDLRFQSWSMNWLIQAKMCRNEEVKV